MSRKMTSKERILAAASLKEPDHVPISPMLYPFLRKHYGRRSWEYELKAAHDFDFDPIIHLGCFDGTPLHNNIRFLNGNYTYEGRAYYEDIAPSIEVDLHIERQAASTIVRRRIKTPAGELNDAIRQPLNTAVRYS